MLRLAVLAHLLLPEVFGLTTLVVLVVGSLWALTEAGIHQAVIQRHELTGQHLHTAWHLGWLRGLLLAVACYLLAPLAGAFFEHRELIALLQLAALIPLLRGFESLGLILLKRELNFRYSAVVDMARELTNTTVAIGLVLYWQATAESLVWALVASTLVGVIVSYLVHGYRPLFLFDRRVAAEFWRFGGHLLGAGLLIFAMTNLDDVVIGKMIGMEALGYYTVAFTLAGVVTTQIVQLMNQLLFPAMSRLQKERERTISVLGRALRGAAGILTPVACFIALFADQIVQVLFGDKWEAVIPALQLLLLVGWVRGIASVFGPVLLARGLTAALHRMKWKEFAVFAVTIIPAVHFLGIVGAAVVLLLVYLLSLVLHLLLTLAELPGCEKIIARQLMQGTIPGFATFLMIWLIWDAVPWSSMLLAGLFAVLWGLLVYVRERDFLLHFWSMRRGEGDLKG